MLRTLSLMDAELAMMSLELMLMLSMFVLIEKFNVLTVEELVLMLRIFVLIDDEFAEA